MAIAGRGTVSLATDRLPVSDGKSGQSLVDTHVHFYDPGRPQGVPWPSREERRLYRKVMPADYRALAVPRQAGGVLVVEASPWVEDNQWVLDLADKDPFILGLVGNLPVGAREFAEHLKRFAANPLFRGIRIRERKLAGTLEEAAFLADLRFLNESGLSLDLVGGLEILPYANRLSQELPDLRIVIDHLAGVRIDGKIPPAEWGKEMKSLISNRNVFFKLSGLVEGTGRSDGTAPRDAEFYRPVLDAMFEMFSPERLIYASNWPVSELFAPLATVQGILQDYTLARGARVREQVFALSGKAAYRWGKR